MRNREIGIFQYLEEGALLRGSVSVSDVNRITEELFLTLFNGHKIITCGNGGSMCDAMHFAEELTGRYKNDRRPLPAIAISDPSHITCTANDFGFEEIFSRYIQAHAKEGDCVLIFSTSGNSPNCRYAATMAKLKGAKVLALLGKDGGRLKDLVDKYVIVPSQDSGLIQEIHGSLIHVMIRIIEQELKEKGFV
jgi:D-sedoheptulose 7-phosphate isomerase